MSQKVSDKELFSESCSRSNEYPECLVQPSTLWQNLESYRDRLDEHAPRLFCPDGEANIGILEYVNSSNSFRMSSQTSSSKIRRHFEGDHLFKEADPTCRYVFIDAPHSRDVLRISREMLMYILTYYQVMPGFLDFIFPFGLQENAQDFHFSAFREETHLLPAEKSLAIKEIGRSGRNISMCFNLKGVERSDAQSWPWSMRQTSAYHSFDIETGKALWIFVKGNEVIEERVQSATSSDRLSRKGPMETPGRVFSSTFDTHLILCEWSVENWRWYINYLEAVLQDMTSRSLAIRIGKNPKSAPEETFHFTKARTLSAAQRGSQGLQPPRLHAPTPPRSRVPSYHTTNPPPSGSAPPPKVLPPGMARPSLEKDHKTEELEDFSFHDLQQVQFIEEKMNECLLVIDSNVHVLTELRGYYNSLTELAEWPLAEACSADVVRFSKRIASTITELRMHHSRAETMLRLLGERKSLLYGILEYHNTRANMSFTRRAEESADRMEKLAVDMHEIAKKTERETVSMRIITLVTLFFLPGTFMSTIMSTDIVKFPTTPEQQDAGKVYHPAALNLYLEVTLPMMVLTFAAWAAMYQWSKRKERLQRKKETSEKSGV